MGGALRTRAVHSARQASESGGARGRRAGASQRTELNITRQLRLAVAQRDGVEVVAGAVADQVLRKVRIAAVGGAAHGRLGVVVDLLERRTGHLERVLALAGRVAFEREDVLAGGVRGRGDGLETAATGVVVAPDQAVVGGAVDVEEPDLAAMTPRSRHAAATAACERSSPPRCRCCGGPCCAFVFVGGIL